MNCSKCGRIDWILINGICEFCAEVPLKHGVADDLGIKIVTVDEYLDSLATDARA